MSQGSFGVVKLDSKATADSYKMADGSATPGTVHQGRSGSGASSSSKNDAPYPGLGPSIAEREAKDKAERVVDKVSHQVDRAEKELLEEDHKEDNKEKADQEQSRQQQRRGEPRQQAQPIRAPPVDVSEPAGFTHVAATPTSSPIFSSPMGSSPMPTPANSPVGATVPPTPANSPNYAPGSGYMQELPLHPHVQSLMALPPAALSTASSSPLSNEGPRAPHTSPVDGNEQEAQQAAMLRASSSSLSGSGATVSSRLAGLVSNFNLPPELPSQDEDLSADTHLARAEAEAAVGRAALARKAIDAQLVAMVQPEEDEDMPQVQQDTSSETHAAAPAAATSNASSAATGTTPATGALSEQPHDAILTHPHVAAIVGNGVLDAHERVLGPGDPTIEDSLALHAARVLDAELAAKKAAKGKPTPA